MIERMDHVGIVVDDLAAATRMNFLPVISHHRRARKPDGTLGGPRKRQWEG